LRLNTQTSNIKQGTQNGPLDGKILETLVSWIKPLNVKQEI